MTCDPIREQLTAYLLGDLDASAAAAVRAHLETCRDCQATAHVIESTLGLVRDALAGAAAGTTGGLSAERRQRALATLTELPTSETSADGVPSDSPRRWLTGWHPRLAIAAGLVLVFGMIWLLTPHASKPTQSGEVFEVSLSGTPAEEGPALRSADPETVSAVAELDQKLSKDLGTLSDESDQAITADELRANTFEPQPIVFDRVQMTQSASVISGEYASRTASGRARALAEFGERADDDGAVGYVKEREAVPPPAAPSPKMPAPATAPAAASTPLLQDKFEKPDVVGSSVYGVEVVGFEGSPAERKKQSGGGAKVHGSVVPPRSVSIAEGGRDSEAPSGTRRVEAKKPKKVVSSLHEEAEPATRQLAALAIGGDADSYAQARQLIDLGHLPPPESVRTEAFINHFSSDDAAMDVAAVSIHAELAPSHFGKGKQLLNLGFKNSTSSDTTIAVEFDPIVAPTHRQLTTGMVRDVTLASGQSVTLLYELRVATVGTNAVIATVHVRYRDSETGADQERVVPVRVGDARASFALASASFRLVAAAAEFAERLRGSPDAAGNSFAEIAETLRPVARELHDDARVQDLLQVVEQAERLNTARP